MQEQLISLETALLAKEKGFMYDTEIIKEDGDCDLGWHSYFRLKSNPEIVNARSHFWHYVNANAQQYEPEAIAPAPTQHLLAKWIREIYKVHVSVGFGQWEDKIWWDFYIWGMKKQAADQEPFVSEQGLNTFEEAMEAGLLEALKSIK